MLQDLHARKRVQLGLGLGIGICFGFLLQKGGVTRYDVIIGQLLFTDFTVLKVMLSAVIVGSLGVHALCSLGLARLHPKAGSWGTIPIGGLLFGIGFALLGYCPGTAVGAVGQGSMDALLGGVVGLLLGAGLFATLYPRLEKSLLSRGTFRAVTLPEWLRVNPWTVVLPMSAALIALLWGIERAGF